MRGKGKRMIPAVETEVAHYGDQGKRKKRILQSKSLTLVLQFECRGIWTLKLFCH